MTTNELLELEDIFQNEFRPLLMKAIYPGDKSGIKYMLTTDLDTNYVKTKYAAIIKKYSPFLIINTEHRNVLDEHRLHGRRIRRADGRHCYLKEAEDFTEPYSDECNPETIAIKKMMYAELYKAIDRLPALQKRRVIEFYFNGKKLAQIAAEEHVSIAAISKSNSASIEMLREMLT